MSCIQKLKDKFQEHQGKIKGFSHFMLSLKEIVQMVFVIFRIVQRCTATLEFKKKLSPDTKSIFQWARDFTSLIFNDIIPLEHLTEKDNLILLAYGFYLAYPFIFLAIKKSAIFSIGSFFSAAFLTMIGLGVFYVPRIVGWILLFGWLILILVAIGLVLVGLSILVPIIAFPIFLVWISFKSLFDNAVLGSQSSVTETDLYVGVLLFVGIFFIVITPVLYKKDGFSIAGTLIGILIIILFIVLIKKIDHQKLANIFILAYNLISSVLVIPIISSLIDLNQSVFGSYWEVIAYVIVVPILSTFIFNIALVITKYSSIISEYKKNKHYFHIFDLLIKYIYAFLSGYDIVWGAISVEIIFIIGIYLYRPYKYPTDYVVNTGEAIVVIAANLLGKYWVGQFSLGISFTILVMAFMPVIVSLYVYFIFDFGKEDEEDEDGTKDIDPVIIDILVLFLLFGYSLYGLSLPITYQ